MINLFKIINKKFFYFLDDWCGEVFLFLSSLTILLSHLLLETHFPKIHFGITVAYLSFLFLYVLRKLFVYVFQLPSSSEEKISNKKPSKSITLNLENYKEISGIDDGFLEDFSRCLDDLIKLNIINYVGSINNNYLLYFHNNELWVVYDKNKEKYIALDLALKTLDDAMGKDSILVLSFYEEIIIKE